MSYLAYLIKMMQQTYYPIHKGLFEEVVWLRDHGLLLMLPWDSEILVSCVQATEKYGENIAEVGAYRGGSSHIIAKYKGSRHLYVFDTWEGHPELSGEKDDVGTNMQSQWKGKHKADFEETKTFLSKHEGVSLHKGIFPQETAYVVEDKKFSYVNLDTDLYTSILDGLEFSYPRMVRGGMITIHDYPQIGGVTRALNEFMKDKPETIFRPSAEQALIVKL